VKPLAVQPQHLVAFVWVSSHWDRHLEGLCRYGKELAHFKWDRTTGLYQISRLTARERLRWLLRKWSFEVCVGRHWTYPHRERHRSRRSTSRLGRLSSWLYYRIAKALRGQR
jgi:hypothetical protein